MGYFETLDNLGSQLKDDLLTDMILQSLPMSYEPFIMNFHMNGVVGAWRRLRGFPLMKLHLMH
jgi:hypothetical protein